MRIYGAAAMSDLLGDLVAYRNLRPVDRRLPCGADLAPSHTPRKGDAVYARIVADILRAARQLDMPGAPLRRLIVVGDTRGSDGGAFMSLCAATGWAGRAFICQEAPGDPPTTTSEGQIDYANRWSALHAFAGALEAQGFAIDAQTVVALDLDKTLVGARGRNDGVIDGARLHALRASVAELLGGAFDESAFEETYRTLNQSRFHSLTGDNQDYVAYICLMIVGGVLNRPALLDLFESGQLADFAALVALAGAHVAEAAPGLTAFHRGIAQLVAAGDPTPFKAFRRREYQETAARMGCRPDDTPVERLLREELILTGEVWELAQVWQARGALLFGLSDKPDEAAIPTDALAAQGALPLHRIRTHIIGP